MTRQNSQFTEAYCLTVEDVQAIGGGSEGAVRSKMRSLFPHYPLQSLKSICAWLQAVTIAKYEVGIGGECRGDKYSAKRIATKTMNAYRDSIGVAFEFRENIGNGQTRPKSQYAQREAFERQCRAVFAESLRVAHTLKQNGGNMKQDEPPKQSAPPKQSHKNDLERYLHWCKNILRPFCDKQCADGHPIDEVGMRYAFDGGRIIAAGGPIQAVMDAVTMHYPEDARSQIGVKQFDFNSYGLVKYLGHLADTRKVKLNGQSIGAVPIYLFGGKGTGKSTIARQLSEELGIPFATVSMTLGTPPSAFYGRQKLTDTFLVQVITALGNGNLKLATEIGERATSQGDVTPSLWTNMFTGGGVFLGDEIDAADPNLLLIINAALANMHFANPVTGEEVKRHPDFIFIAAANTLGLGGGRDYVGRERLDAATLDRFAAGRVRYNIDTDLETRIASTIQYL